MAENETLDLWDGHSGRWRKLLQKIARGESEENVAEEATRCLYQTFKGLAKLLPLAELLAAADKGHREVHAVVRRINKARDYAQLFELEARVRSNRQAIVGAVIEATLEKYFGQIGHKLIGSIRFPSAFLYDAFYDRVHSPMRESIARLSSQISANPGHALRMPSRSTAKKDQEHRELYGLSLRNVT